MTVEEYLSFEKAAGVKNEFVDGFVFAMAGVGNAHKIVALNIGAILRVATRGKSCRAYLSDMKLRVSDETYYYPDVFVTCDEDDLTTNIKTTACFVIEILYESMSDIDRGEKMLNYSKLASLQAYILVSQKQRLLEVHRRLEDDTWRHDIVEAGDIKLPCLDISLSLDEVYEDVFEA